MRAKVVSAFRRESVAALLLVLAVAAPLAEPAGAKKKPPKLPDLSISGVTFTPFAFQGESARAIKYCDNTTNGGTAPTSRMPFTTMGVSARGVSGLVADRDFRNLGPTEAHHGCGRGKAARLDLPLGAYDVLICASARGEPAGKRGDNCFRCEKCFFVVKRTWSGGVSGIGGWGIEGPGSETWQSLSGLTFTFDPKTYKRRGRFEYALTAGSVTYKDGSGPVDTGCAKDGALTDYTPEGKLALDYVAETYSAFGRAHLGFSYPIHNSCDPEGAAKGPGNPVFLNSGIGTSPPRQLPFGTDELVGTYAPDEDYTVTWTLH